MGWSRVLIVPHVIRLSVRAPRDASTRWDRYWADVQTTGDAGDVLWDASGPEEAQRYLDLLAAHADLRLPIIDIGCGNGRFTRALAGLFPRTLGTDLSEHAITRAQQESDELVETEVGAPEVGAPEFRAPEFRATDMTSRGAGQDLASEFGPCNVFIRGVLHVLDRRARQLLAANVRALTGTEGTALVAETNFAGPRLGYLEHLGAGPRGIPAPLARAIASGIPAPASFGTPELDDCFSPGVWDRVVVDDTAEITAVPMQRSGERERIPALVAVLRHRALAGSWQPDGHREPGPRPS